MSELAPEDAVAVIGLACRTAGGNNTPEKLWEFILNKKNASGEVNPSRWEPWRRRDPRNSKILDNIIRKGYFLNDLENFDASFFNISPREAELMDPHQRIALELAWEALENAGINPKTLAGSDTAVFMGVDSDDYSRMLIEDLPNIEAWSGISTAAHGIPNRISYFLDLQGPSTAVDAACASSLIAIHLARQAIVTGESTVAICGGVNVICAPGLSHMLQKAGALSPDGVCRSFDDDAAGYARGEGGATIILKRLDAALKDGDHVLAVLRGSASCSDGKTDGIMAPNTSAQELVARRALQKAGNIDPLTIGYVEAHATSTALGDPTEVRAIANVYGKKRPKTSPCYVGSIKPNVGHLEAAAGAIGFVKAVLSIQKGVIAPQALLNKLNTKIDWANSGIDVPRETIPWPKNATGSPGIRRAAICCYGYGGSVCHAVIEQAPASTQIGNNNHGSSESDSPVMLTLSTRQEKRLATQASLLADWLSAGGASERLRDVARTLSQRRALHEYRASFVVRDHQDAIESLRAFSSGTSSPWTSSSRVLDNKKDVVWVFSGHGAQWANMGKDLVTNPVFKAEITKLEPIVSKEANFSVIQALEKGELGGSDKVQILTYVMQIGLAAVLRSKGLEPNAIIGHSVGEIAASVTAGCLTAAEGALLVSRRALLYKRVQGQGAMALVSLPFEEMDVELSGRRDLVAAISSSPSTCVISGEVAAVEAYLALATERGIKTWKVQTDVSFHSPLLDTLVKPLQEALHGALHPQPARIPLYSTSNPNSRSECLRDIAYWVENMVGPVRLLGAVNTALNDGYRLFMEVSSHPIVTHSISETLSTRSIEDAVVLGAMKRDTAADCSILHAVSQIFVLGANVNFGKQIGAIPWSTKVPNMPWDHKPYWKTISDISSASPQNHDVDKHTLLGGKVEIAGSSLKVWTTTLDETTKPYPLTHPLDDTEIIPAAVYCTTFQKASGATVLEDLELKVPTPMSKEKREVQIVLDGETIRLSSRLQPSSQTKHAEGAQHAWLEHSTAKARSIDLKILQEQFSLQQLQARICDRLSNDFAWDYLQRIGVKGIAYPWGVLEHRGNSEEMLIHVDMDPDSSTLSWDADSYAPFLDAATSIGSSIFFNSIRLRVVSGIDRVLFVSKEAPPKTGWLLVKNTSEEEQLRADISILNEEGSLIAKLQGMRFSDVEALSDTTQGIDALAHKLAWVPALFSETALNFENLVIMSTQSSVLQRFKDSIKWHQSEMLCISSVEQLQSSKVAQTLQIPGSAFIYLPETIGSYEEIVEKSHAFTWTTVQVLKVLSGIQTQPKLYVITSRTNVPTTLAHAPLNGFARVAASEYFDQWGGLIDCDEEEIPSLPLKYVQGQAVIRMQDGLPRVPRMRRFGKEQLTQNPAVSLLPRKDATYLVTGGFGSLGLAVLDFLVRKGARRIVVVSRRALPPRKQWRTLTDGDMAAVVESIEKLERLGASIHALAYDIGSPKAPFELLTRIESLNLPPIRGVVHAAGVSLDGFIKDTTPELLANVMAPKIQGTINLDNLFPVGSLDFMVLFSSIGQLLGTPGQVAYASSNAFLDAVAMHRRSQGCNTVAIQWTAWRDMGMAKDNDILEMELSSQGVTDVTAEEAFEAWEHISKYDTDQAVVTRIRVLGPDEPVPCALITDIVQRRAPTISTPDLSQTPSSSSSNSGIQTPLTGPELKESLRSGVRQCLSTVLHLDAASIDDRAAISDLGIDSVMTVALRQQLQKHMGVKIPPTLTWNYPTVVHLADWLYEKLAE